MGKSKNMHRIPAVPPLAYFITFRTYGTWLHGDERGWVDERHNAFGTHIPQGNTVFENNAACRMRNQPFLLAADSAALVEKTIREVCAHRGWPVRALQARTNHVHVVVSAAVSPERVMNDLKAWGTRRLREQGYAGRDQDVWADHGSTPYLWTDGQLAGAIDYVKNWQGGPLQKTWDDVRREIDSREQNP